jgi:hypothetical protein
MDYRIEITLICSDMIDAEEWLDDFAGMLDHEAVAYVGTVYEIEEVEA